MAEAAGDPPPGDERDRGQPESQTQFAPRAIQSIISPLEPERPLSTGPTLSSADRGTSGDSQLALILALHAAQHGVRWTRPQEDLRRAVEVLTGGRWPHFGL